MRTLFTSILVSISVLFFTNSSANSFSLNTAKIELSTTSLSFGQVFEGTTLLRKITLTNNGDQTLTLGPLNSTNEDFYAFYAGGSTLGGIDILAGDSINIFVVFEANNLGTSSGNISITSSIPTVQFSVTGIGVTPPSATISPDSLNEEINSGDLVNRAIMLGNSEGADLKYSLDIQFATSSELVSESEVFTNKAPVPIDKENITERKKFTIPQQLYVSPEIYQEQFFIEGSNINSIFVPELEEILFNIDEGLQGIANLIQNRYNFGEGLTGFHISDGGDDMYDAGNYLLIDDAYSLNYSDLTITTASGNGSNVEYFTSKKEGIFTFVGNFEGAESFQIAGGLGADGGGNVKGASFEVTIFGKKFTVYTKQVYNAGDPSVNHIIIVANGAGTSQQFSTSTDDDFHKINNLSQNTRIYYILFAGNNGKEFSMNEMETIATSYLNLFSFTPPYISISEEYLNGVVVAGDELVIPVEINASGLIDSTYYSRAVISTNDPVLQNKTIPIRIKVNGAPGISVKPDNLNFGNLFVGKKDSIEVTITNGGTDNLQISEVILPIELYSFSPDVNLPIELMPGENLKTNVIFAPTGIEEVSGTLTFVSNDPNNGTFEVPISGAGVAPPIVGVDPEMLSFSLNSGDSVSSSFQISNSGGSDLFYELSTQLSNENSSSADSISSIYLSFENYDSQLGRFQTHVIEYSLEERQILDTLYSRDVENYSIISLAQNNKKLYFNDGDNHQVIVYDIEDKAIEMEISLETKSNSDDYIYSLAHSGTELYGIIYAQFENSFYLVQIDEETGSFTDTLYTESSGGNQLISVTVNKKEDIVYVGSFDGRIRVFDLQTFEQLPDFINDFNYRFNNLSYSSSRNSIFTYDTRSREIIEFDAEDASLILRYNVQNLSVLGMATDESEIFNYLEVLSNSKDTLGEGSSKAIDFKVRTEGMLGGIYNSEFTIKSNDPLNPELKIPMSLTVVGVPEISVSKDTLRYGELFVGASKVLEIIIENSGTDNLELSAFSFTGTEFRLKEEVAFPISLEPSKSQKFLISYNPSTVGLINNTLTIQTNANTIPDYTITLLGVGIEPPIINLSDNELSYSVNVGDSVAGSFTINNEGNSPLYVNVSASTGRSIKRGNAALSSEFSVAQSASVQNNSRIFGLVQSGNQETLIAEFSPVDGRVIDSTLIVNQQGGGPEGLAFNGELVYYFTTVFNEMIFAVNPDTRSIVDTLFIEPSTFDALGHSGDFLYALDYQQDQIVKIDPETGEFISTLQFDSEYDLVGGLSFGGSRGTIFVSAGAGPVLEIDIDTGDIINSVINPTETFKAGLGYSDISGTLWIVAQDDANENQPTLFEVSPDNGQVIKKFPTRATIYALASNETTKPNFLTFLSTTSDTIAAGEEKLVEFGLSARGLFGGIYNLEFTISSNDPANSNLFLPLDLEVIGIPELTIKPDTLNFGKQIMEGDYTRYISFENTGTDDVTLNELLVTGSNFFTSNEDTSFIIPPSQAILYPITFSTAMFTGKFEGLMEFTTNGLESGVGRVYLKGEAIKGPIIVFEKQNIELELKQNEVLSHEFTISNSGDSTLVLNFKANSGLSSETQVLSMENLTKDILVVQDRFSWDINAGSVIENAFPNYDLTSIQSSQLQNQGLDEFEMVITVGGQNSSYYSNLSANQTKLEAYADQGGIILYSASTFGPSINIAGGTVSIFDNEFHQIIVNEDHPMLKGFINEDFTSIGNNNVLRSIPDNAEVALIGIESREPTFIEYELGQGYVVVSSVAIEYLHNRSTVISKMQNFYIKTLRYVDSISLTPSWIEMDTSPILIAPGEDIIFSVNINPADLDIGVHKAHIVAESNIADSSELLFADIVLDVKLGTSSEIESILPEEVELSQNYPNPFNPSTNITYGLPKAAEVQIKVYNVLGQQVMTLVDDFKKAGRYSATFDAGRLSSGVYFYRMTVDGQELEIKKMLLLK